MKWFAIVGLLLFFGVAIAPSINANLEKEYYPHTFQLSLSDIDSKELEDYLDNLKPRLAGINSRLELQEIIDELEAKFDSYGITLELDTLIADIPEEAFHSQVNNSNNTNSNCFIIGLVEWADYYSIGSRLLQYHYEKKLERAEKIVDFFGSLFVKFDSQGWYYPSLLVLLLLYPIAFYSFILYLLVDPENDFGLIYLIYNMFINRAIRVFLPFFKIYIRDTFLTGYEYLFTVGNQGKKIWETNFNAEISGFNGIKLYPSWISLTVFHINYDKDFIIGYARQVDVYPRTN